MNYHLFQLVNGLAGSSDPVDDTMEWAARWLIFVAGALALVPLAVAARRPPGRPAVVRVMASLLLAFAAGQLLARVSTEVRPFQTHRVHQLIPHDSGASLPSDHATAAFAVAVAVGAFLSWRWGAALCVLAAVVGLARVWVGVHYPGDILAGALIGAGSVAIVTLGGKALDRYRHSPRSPAGSR